jgi:hypothetical protein
MTLGRDGHRDRLIVRHAESQTEIESVRQSDRERKDLTCTCTDRQMDRQMDSQTCSDSDRN